MQLNNPPNTAVEIKPTENNILFPQLILSSRPSIRYLQQQIQLSMSLSLITAE